MSHKVRPGPRKRKARARESQKARRGLWVFFGGRWDRLSSSAVLQVTQVMPELPRTLRELSGVGVSTMVELFPNLRDYVEYHSRKQVEILERLEAGE